MSRGRRNAHALRGVLVMLQLVRVLGGCERDSLDLTALVEPATCQGCHPDEYREWSGSMHAYASDDPVFRAMNRRGQRETHGALGGLCANCHAPMAVQQGATIDGQNLDELPRELHGVTCLFCHSTQSVEGDHNNPLVLAGDGVMRAQFADPMTTPAHASTHEALLDGRDPRSARACGACHDVVTAIGLPQERTFAEWQASLFAQPGTELSCIACHMKTRESQAADVRGAPQRLVASHELAGLDLATTPWPETEAQRAAITDDLEPSISAKLCVAPGPGGLQIDVTLDNIAAGHAWPSGVTHARRAWVEVTASAAGASVLDDTSWILGQTLRAADGRAVEMPWEAVSQDSVLLPAAVTANPQDPAFYHSVTRSFQAPPDADVVSITVRIQPIAQAVLDDLAASGDLPPQQATTFTIESSRHTWLRTDGYGCP
ncbi:MAG: multiheme c-type cytochrome [Kofleriaceae bacterium]